MALSEIEKLERRYAENPQGLTFAPLAEVHRKSGDLARALDLLRSGLELHPDYIPASIVLGRCHLDMADLSSAEAAFSHVLALDGENVIALKALADISERQHHFDQAERWLQTLLSVDRSNDEARAQLERIELARRDSAAAPPPPSLGEEPAVTEEPVALVAEPEAGAEETSAIAEPASAVEEEPLLGLADLEPAALSDDEPEEPPPGLQLEEAPALEEPVEPLEGLVGRDVDEATPAVSDFRVELSEDIVLRSSGGQEFQVPDAALELSDRMPPPPVASPFAEEFVPEIARAEEPARPPAREEPLEVSALAAEPAAEPVAAPEAFPEPRVNEPAAEPPIPVESPVEPSVALEPPAELVTEPEPAPAHAAAPEAAPESAPSPPAGIIVPPEPEPVVTETMAEVLLQQGHSVEALRVYRELEVRNAGDPRLLQKIAELTEASRTEPSPAARRAYTAAEAGGQSVGDFFRGLLGARPPAAASAPPAARPAPAADRAGAPTRPAADALSLSSVFGDDASPLPPAVPAAGAPPAGGVSFDEFYGPPATGSSANPRAPDPKNDDLDQFHAWLQNLKR